MLNQKFADKICIFHSILASKLREKEWKKIDVILNRKKSEDRNQIIIGSCENISQNLEVCRLMRLNALKMHEYKSEQINFQKFIEKETIPLILRQNLAENDQEDFHFDDNLHILSSKIRNFEIAIERNKINLCLLGLGLNFRKQLFKNLKKKFKIFLLILTNIKKIFLTFFKFL